MGSQQPAARAARVLDKRYHLGRLLGRGGTGAVYEAHDRELQRAVAVKVVAAQQLPDHDARLRFDQHAQLVLPLRHPSIVPLLDAGTLPDGGAYLVMELVAGEDLRCVLQREGSLEATRAATILASVSAGLEAAHREGILHLDLKPENILLPAAEPETARVVDFGSPGVGAMGTPAYMAPEQLHGRGVDARTDVFALGVIACEMLGGELPFGRGTAAEISLAQSRGKPRMPEGIPAAMDRAIRAALAPDADRRPATPQAFSHLVSASAGA